MKIVPIDSGEVTEPSTAQDIAPGWYAALTLQERIAFQRSLSAGKATITSQQDLAQRRLRRWESEPAFATDRELFQERLAEAAISESQFLHLLGVTPASLAGVRARSPAWWALESAPSMEGDADPAHARNMLAAGMPGQGD